jgi:predicted nicotinamide N-methyase
MWPSAVVLAHWLVREASSLQLGGKKRILELGAGCGLAGLVAVRLQRQRSAPGRGADGDPCVVYLSDYNSAVLDNLERNASLNDVTDDCRVVGLDFYQQTGTADSWEDTAGKRREPVDVILAADVICKAEDAAAVARTVHDALQPGGGRAFVVCAGAAHRFGVEHLETDCRRVGLQVATQDVKDMFRGELLSLLEEDLHKTTGYVEGMSFTAFTLTKPSV